MTGKQTQWLDYLPSPVLAVRATCHFCAAAMQDGSLNVYSHTGRRYVHSRLERLFKGSLHWYQDHANYQPWGSVLLHGCQQTLFVGHHFGWRIIFVVNISCK